MAALDPGGARRGDVLWQNVPGGCGAVCRTLVRDLRKPRRISDLCSTEGKGRRLAAGLRRGGSEDEEKNPMLESVRKLVVPSIPGKVLLSATTIASFAWLLAQDRIHPLVVWALQLYLSF